MDRAPAPPFASLALAAGAASVLWGCTPSIGDRCTLSTDCSVQGTRLCDTSQPGGYCTQLRCTSGSCPDHASCVEFGASLDGCPYDDYNAPSPTGRAMCMKTCHSDSDCRESDGYSCVDPMQASPGAVILDADRSERVCMATWTPVDAAIVDARAVCSPNRPDVGAIQLSAEPGADGSDGQGGGPSTDASTDEDNEEAGEPADGTPDANMSDALDGS